MNRDTTTRSRCLLSFLMILPASAALAADAETFVNSVGMKMIRIEAGQFVMGSQDGDWDERPVRTVTISRPFHMSTTEVTNGQYEQFDPDHRKLRGKLGFSRVDDEAVVFVSWHEAVAFCKWLSEKEGKPYRLPTEAEWEYACRAGTTTAYHTGDTLPEAFHKNVRNSWFPAPSRTKDSEVVSLTVAKTSPNAWGLYDMHGNAEEWCADWYGPYATDARRQVVAGGLACRNGPDTVGENVARTVQATESAKRFTASPR